MSDGVTDQQKFDLLKNQVCFSQLSDDEINELATLLSVKKYKAGDIIVTQGDTVDSVFLIVSGKADVRFLSIKDNAIHSDSLAQLNPGDAIGLNDAGFYSLTGLRTATVIAQTDMVLLQLNVAEFHGFSLSHTHVSKVMHRNLTTLWNQNQKG